MMVSDHHRAGGVHNQRTALLAAAAVLLWASVGFAQKPEDKEAERQLTNARQALAEKNYPVAVNRYRDFLGRFGTHKEAPAARYHLAFCLLQSSEKDYGAVLEQLQPLTSQRDLPEYPFVLYYQGLANRGLGIRALSQRGVNPQEATRHQAVAYKHFEAAEQSSAAAAVAFRSWAKAAAPEAGPLPDDLEWSLRAQCDQAEMQLRTGKIAAAHATAVALLKDPLLARSRSRGLALYYHGVTEFLQEDYAAAARSLNPLTLFHEPGFGNHARYLMARIHHAVDEHAEAMLHYEGVLADYEKEKKDAVEALRRPEKFKNNPGEKARLEALVKEPPPDYLGRALFYLGQLQYEGGRFADAEARFSGLLRQHPKSPLLIEAQFRLGLCQVQARKYAEAVRTLQPLVEREPRLADQVLFWLGKAQAGAADPNNAGAYQQALKAAQATFRRAANLAQQQANDSEAKVRYGRILFELADTQQLAKQHREAAATYARLLDDKAVPEREEEVWQRLADALSLAGDFDGSDKVCLRFQKAFPRSPLLPAVLYRHAENAASLALAAEDRARGQEEAARRYQAVVEKFPEFEYANRARYGLAMTFYHQKDFDKAREILATIPAPERTGDLALAPYLLADCLIRLAPTKADDAVTAGRMEEQLKGAIELLDSFVSAQPRDPQAPEALLRLGLCHQRLALLFAEPKERAKALHSARSTYDRLLQQFPKHAAQPQAVFERARCRALAGDPNGAINDLRRFNDEPLKRASLAPLALLQMATLLRGQNKAGEAANVLEQCRKQHEQVLRNDPERAAWATLLQYHHGVALKEAGKPSEARNVLESLAKQSPASPEAAEAALRWAQCLKEEGKLQVLLARLSLVIVGSHEKKLEVLAAGKKELDEGAKAVREAVRFLETQADLLKEKQAESPVRARMLYEIAWSYRNLDEAERIMEEAKDQRGELRRLPEVPKAEGTRPGGLLRAHEQKARETYQALIAGFPDLPLANEARLELSELCAERGGHGDALKLLNEALDKEPPAELTEKIRIRLGLCQAGLGDIKTALAQFDLVTRNPKSPHAGLAHLHAGECLLRAGDTAGAVRHLALFRDQQPFRNLEKVTERGLLLLGRAYARQKQWDQSRQAYEQMSNRFGNSRWADEAQYGLAWAWQNQKQYDSAVNAYNRVTRTTRGQLAAHAQLQIGLCRLEQKRYQEAATELLVVPAKYGAADLSSVALVEAARAHAELKQRDQAEKLLRQALRDYPESKPADVARERLQALPDGKPFPRRDIAVPTPEMSPSAPALLVSQPQPDRASLEDPTGEYSLTAALTASPPERRTPAPFLRLTLPDPFEHRQAIRLRSTPPEEPLPLRDGMTGVLPLLK